jgi:hypothetical protein
MKKVIKPDTKETPKVDRGSLLMRHYDDANAELQTRITHKERGFDTYEKVYRNYINKTNWPFDARVPDGRGASLIDRKTDRLLANKLQGRFTSTNSGDELGARVATELVLAQWNEVDLRSNTTMLMRWKMMDSRARRFGKAYGRWSWRRMYDGDGKVVYDGPWFEPWDNRDVLVQPGSRTTDDADYLILRDYLTLGQMKRINELAKTGPVYDPDILKKLSEGDMRETNYQSVNRDVVGLSSTELRIEVCYEYNQARGTYTQFCPKQGNGKKDAWILREFKNPFPELPTIPVIELCYYPVDDDAYGKPELESVLPLIKSNWAFMSQVAEEAQNELYAPLMVNPINAQLDTLEFKSGARWLMQKPGEDVRAFENSQTLINKFIDLYGLYSSLIMEGVGETGQDVSIAAQTFTDKTATEIKDSAMLRSTRDNANKTILSQALARMVHAWLKMSQKMLTGTKLIKVTGKDALQYLIDEELHGYTLSDEGAKTVHDYVMEHTEELERIAKDTGREVFEVAYEKLRAEGQLDQYATPLFPVEMGGQTVPQLQLEKDKKSGFLTTRGKDIAGDYNFFVDIESMSIPNDAVDVQARKMLFDSTLQVEQQLNAQGYTVKWKELLEKLGDIAKVTEVEQYFEKQMNGGVNATIGQPNASQGTGVSGAGLPIGGVLPKVPLAGGGAPPPSGVPQPQGAGLGGQI